MVLENFYTVTEHKAEENNSHSFDIKVNKDHEIFKGHFPENPVMPGVCMMQIIKDLTEETTGKKLFMDKCSNVKFTALINPEINDKLNLNLVISEDENGIKVKNISKFEDTIALKLSAHYRIL